MNLQSGFNEGGERGQCSRGAARGIHNEGISTGTVDYQAAEVHEEVTPAFHHRESNDRFTEKYFQGSIRCQNNCVLSPNSLTQFLITTNFKGTIKNISFFRTWTAAVPKEETASKATPPALSTAAQHVSGSMLTFNGRTNLLKRNWKVD